MNNLINNTKSKDVHSVSVRVYSKIVDNNLKRTHLCGKKLINFVFGNLIAETNNNYYIYIHLVLRAIAYNLYSNVCVYV